MQCTLQLINYTSEQDHKFNLKCRDKETSYESLRYLIRVSRDNEYSAAEERSKERNTKEVKTDIDREEAKEGLRATERVELLREQQQPFILFYFNFLFLH